MLRPVCIAFMSSLFIVIEICEALSCPTATTTITTPTTVTVAAADANTTTATTATIATTVNIIKPISFESMSVPPTTEHLTADHKSTGICVYIILSMFYVCTCT